MKDCRLCLPLGYEATLAKPTTQFCPLLSLSHLLTSNESRCLFGDPINSVTPSAGLTQVIFTHFLVFQVLLSILIVFCFIIRLLLGYSDATTLQSPKVLSMPGPNFRLISSQLKFYYNNIQIRWSPATHPANQPPTDPVSGLVRFFFEIGFSGFLVGTFSCLILCSVLFSRSHLVRFRCEAKKSFFPSHLI